MNKSLDRAIHIFLYLSFSLGLLAIFRWRFDGGGQFLVILALVIFYIIWGFVYHNLKRDLTVKILLEYLAIAAIASLAAILVFVR